MLASRALHLAAALVFAAGAGTALPFNERPVRSILEARHQNVVVQEWDSSCGAAALATLLRYQLGDPVTERIVAVGMLRGTDPDRVRGRGGFSLLDMKRYAESRGFAAEGYAGLTPGQLMRLAPAIVPIRSYGGDHFVVFRGVAAGQAVLADPAFGNRSLPFAEFAALWKDGLGFAVAPPRGKRGNRLLATRGDVLRVEDEAARAGMDAELPRPLADAQLAGIVVALPLAPEQSAPSAAHPGETATALPSTRGPATTSVAASTSSAFASSASTATSLGTSSGAVAPALPSTTSVTVTTTNPVTVTTPLQSISVTSPISLPGVSVSAPPLPAVSLPAGIGH